MFESHSTEVIADVMGVLIGKYMEEGKFEVATTLILDLRVISPKHFAIIKLALDLVTKMDAEEDAKS